MKPSGSLLYIAPSNSKQQKTHCVAQRILQFLTLGSLKIFRVIPSPPASVCVGKCLLLKAETIEASQCSPRAGPLGDSEETAESERMEETTNMQTTPAATHFTSPRPAEPTGILLRVSQMQLVQPLSLLLFLITYLPSEEEGKIAGAGCTMVTPPVLGPHLCLPVHPTAVPGLPLLRQNYL